MLSTINHQAPHGSLERLNLLRTIKLKLEIALNIAAPSWETSDASIMPHDELTDDYVAELLKEDAKKTSQKYARLGFSGLLPGRYIACVWTSDPYADKFYRPTNHAPKPNLRFLRNILRETDNHNAALLAKEAEESKAKLKDLKSSSVNGTQKDSSGRSRKRRRSPDDDIKERYGGGSKRRDRREESPIRYTSRRDKSRGRRSARKREESSSDSESRHRTSTRRRAKHGSRSREKRSEREREKHSSNRGPGHSRKSRSRSPSDSENTSRRHRKHTRRKRDRSRESDSSHHNADRCRRISPDKLPERTSDKSESDSDPLEELVGPLPPIQKPTIEVRKRGRGAFTSTGDLSMDAHFAADYNPSADVRPDSDHDDDWEEALEAMRDRQRWKQQGADRLRQAGFTEAQIRSWEKGDDKNEDDVRWAKKGEGREWDRGKVLDDDGNIALKPEWGRLKGT
jgi:hypothetical protein